jgi:outer membrane protein OmpA-like peptidoglycan-associated protein
MNKNLFLAPLLVFCVSLNAQKSDQKKKFFQAEKYYYDSLFLSALPIYEELAQKNPDNGQFAYKTGVCYLNSPTEKKKSIPFLEKACNNASTRYKEGNFKEVFAPVDAYFFMAEALHQDYRFEEAIVYYEKFKTYVDPKDIKGLLNLEWKIKMCNNGKELVSSPVEMIVTNLGSNINTNWPEYSAVLSADQSTLVFTSRRPENVGGKKDKDGLHFEDIYISYKTENGWSKATNIGAPINTDKHEASVGISPDGQNILIYKDDGGDGNIYITSLVGTEWSTPKKLSRVINSKSWEPSACFSPDGNTIYFVSDTAGGFGGRDIYRCVKMGNGDWSRAVNLGPTINTQFDEEAPFMQADGVTLYFSSKGHNSMGGFDIFTSKLTEAGWTKPENLGYPVNTPGDDVFFFPTPDNVHAFYSSFQAGGFGEKDIYEISFPTKKEAPVVVYTGTLNSIFGGVPQGAQITITDNVNGDVVGVYTPNSATGKYVFILPPGKDYNINYEADGFLFQSDNFVVHDSSAYQIINRAIELEPIKVGTRVVLNNIFFDFDKASLRPESAVELQKLQALLEKFPKMIVEISGFTDSKGTKDYNLKLSQQRAESVVKFLTDRGISKSRLFPRGYGEADPAVSNTTVQGRQLNRRIEFKIVGLEGKVEIEIPPIKLPKEK